VARGPSDLDLIRAYLGGDVHAFDTLFRRYHKAIYGLTFRLLRDRQLAEDLTQETFFQILRTIHRINDSFNFSAWIHRIATNLCYDELRRRKKFPEVQEIDEEESEDSVGCRYPQEPGGGAGDQRAAGRGLGSGPPAAGEVPPGADASRAPGP
jgi:RNA polymerase sigma factor (sigma-70 family)